MARGVLAGMCVLMLLVPASAGAQAVAYDFSVNPNPPNEDQATTFGLLPQSATGISSVTWDLDGDGSFDDGSGRTVTRTYVNRGSVTVRSASARVGRRPADGHEDDRRQRRSGG